MRDLTDCSFTFLYTRLAGRYYPAAAVFRKLYCTRRQASIKLLHNCLGMLCDKYLTSTRLTYSMTDGTELENGTLLKDSLKTIFYYINLHIVCDLEYYLVSICILLALALEHSVILYKYSLLFTRSPVMYRELLKYFCTPAQPSQVK